MAGEKGAFHTKAWKLAVAQALSSPPSSSQLCYYCKIIDELMKFPAKEFEISNYLAHRKSSLNPNYSYLSNKRGAHAY